MDPAKSENSHYQKPQKKGFSCPSKCLMCLKEEETIQHLFLDCTITKECWKQLSSLLEINLNFSKTFLNFFLESKKTYPYSTKKKATIKRFWDCLPAMLCWQIWLSRNKSIFKDREPKMGRIL